MLMNLISIIIGFVALALAIVGLLPMLGWLNWLVLVLALLGAVIGIFAVKRTGLNLNLVVMIVAIFRLVIGGGII